MNSPYIFDTAPLTKVKIEYVLFESYYPILFTARNDKDVLFLCVCFCAENNTKKWLVTKSNEKTIVDMLKDKITIRDAFLKSSGDRYTIISRGEDITVTPNVLSDWDSDNSEYLPTVGEYMDSEENEFEEEINFYSKRIISQFDSKIKISVEMNNLKSNCLTWVTAPATRSIVNISITNIIPSTMNRNNVYRKEIKSISNEYVLSSENIVNDLCLAS